MEKPSSLITPLFIIISAAVVFVFVTWQSGGVSDKYLSNTASTDAWLHATASGKAVSLPEDKMVVTAKHAFRKSVHIIAGELPLPTRCHTLQARATMGKDGKDAILALVSSILTGQQCKEEFFGARFKVEFIADEKIKIRATVNGNPVVLNLIPAGATEDLDAFDLYIKG